MDASIRLYNTNSGLQSFLETEQESRSRPTTPLPVEQDDGKACEEMLDTSPEMAVAAVQEEVQKVDIADFEAIFLRFQAPITNFIYHLIGNREQAYDLTQDVFVKAYRALLGGTVVQPGALSAWLYRIAANTTTDSLRRRRLISWLPLSLFNEDRGIGAGVLSDSGGTAAEGMSAGEEVSEGRASSVSTLYERNGYDGGVFEGRVADREVVERVFNKLPQKYAVCLWLYENDGFSCAEIAQVLNISPSAVKMRLMRARERFISLYQQEVSDE
ncbi:MAG TPA: sigma-70 family RNA polymerase sigma factor [Ktedonobacteraceae bacterium]|nr:sigma-70 family RNA polymerase sigma factor [Ktedonobacteraceae bacterium]